VAGEKKEIFKMQAVIFRVVNIGKTKTTITQYTTCYLRC
jgi:hypothetical protein